MPICLQCGQHHGSSHELCPDCVADSATNPSENDTGLDFDAAEGECRVTIARFQNGAEAGYFADELTRQTGFEVGVLVREKFDAVHAVWAIDYILLVSPQHAQEAPRALQSLVDATGDDAGEESSMPSASDIPAGIWVPLILTLAAGSIACFGIEHLDHRPRPPALVVGDGRKPPELWEILGATNGPWVQQLEGGRGVRRLTLNRDHRSALLEEDHDGDGFVDREWEFSWEKR